jgi:hypothetical protein
MLLCLTAAVVMAAAPASTTSSRGRGSLLMQLSNQVLNATIDATRGGGLTSLSLAGVGGGSGHAFQLAGDSFSVTVSSSGGPAHSLAPGVGLRFVSAVQGASNVSLQYAADGGGTVTAVYSLQPGWRVLSKRLLLALPASNTITGVALLGAAGINMSATPPTTCCWATDYGKPEGLNKAASFYRCSSTATSSASARSTGLLVSVTNPFGRFSSSQPAVASAHCSGSVMPGVTAGYANVGVSLTMGEPTLTTDHVLIGPYTLRDSWVRPHSLSGVDKGARVPAMLNAGERDAFVEAVEGLLLPSPDDGRRTVKVNVAWDENDYQACPS